MNNSLTLNGFQYNELFHSAGLKRLDDSFMQSLQQTDPALHDWLLAYHANKHTSNLIETSDLLISCAKILEDFLAKLFGIEEAVAISQAKTISNNPISTFKKYYVLRRAKKEASKLESNKHKEIATSQKTLLAMTTPDNTFANINDWLNQALKAAPLSATDRELSISLLGDHYLTDPEKFAADIEKLVQWCVQALVTPEGQAAVKGWVSFHIPERIDHQQLIKTIGLHSDKIERVTAPDEEWRLRDGFKLTDPRMNAREVQDEVNYCIYCHDHDGDFCSKGFPVKKGDPAQGLKKNPLDLTMTGCPLEERISEMHLLKRDGHTLGSLAMVMVDNPMCPATGHRICNDCMKSCIYQKQEPVNIPQIETRVLTDVLDLPWGVEIYDLMTRWNPLRQQQWTMKPYNGLKVMIAGMGPAGFTLAHHLLLEGFAVVGFDGLKIEPLPEYLINTPIKHFSELKEALDERIMAGFGGVAEYGITVRWDKNFLKLIYLSLMRKPHFQVFGGVRFGGTLTIEDAWSMGFDHFAVAVGAGLPRALPIPGSMAPGMRQANDFLMALQLGNAAKASSLTSLQIRLPAVVIGGGLTGVDTATELQAYYISQVEKMLTRYEILSQELGDNYIEQQLDAASREILREYLEHGKAVRDERARAAANKQQPNFIKLAHEWGGVTIAYRRSMQESPAYINNHEELREALEEGIFYAEGLEPTAVDLNKHGYAEALICHKRLRNAEKEWVTTTETVRLPARSILVATGTQPNTAYEFEHRGTFNRVNLQYQHYEDENGELVVAHGVAHCKDEKFGAFTSYHKNDKRVSLVGDTHPVFHGNVVKAIASGMRTYPKILALLQDKLAQRGDVDEYEVFATHIRQLFSAQVVSILRKTPRVIELTVHAPLAAKHFKSGQFYRLQNFETLAPRVDHTLLQMEPLPLVTAEVDTTHGSLTFLVNENSATAKLCATLKPGEPISLMGPTGVRARIAEEHETILIIGNQTGFAFLRNYGKALRSTGNKVIFLAQLASEADVFSREQLEASADAIIWLTKDGELVTGLREQDRAYAGGDIIATLLAYQANEPAYSLGDVDRIYLTSTTDTLRTFQAARRDKLKNILLKDPKVIGSIYGNMQCMLKGVCAQCLQWQIDPETGQRTKAVFACSWQDQPLEIIDIDHVDERAAQNRLLDTFNQLWVDHVFTTYDIARV